MTALTTLCVDAGRVIRTIENYVDGDPSTGSSDEDVTVATTYTTAGQLATLTAMNATTGDQVVARGRRGGRFRGYGGPGERLRQGARAGTDRAGRERRERCEVKSHGGSRFMTPQRSSAA